METLEITAAALAQALAGADPPRLLDVRTPEEQALVALDGHQLLTAALWEVMQRDWPKDTPIVAYCHHGIRSLDAARFLQNAGFANVRSLRGGIEAWAVDVDPSLPRY